MNFFLLFIFYFYRPWSFPTCDRDQQRAQEISGCDITNHYALNTKQGRGATEIDIIEVMAGPSGKLPICKNNLQRPYSSMTLQVLIFFNIIIIFLIVQHYSIIEYFFCEMIFAVSFFFIFFLSI
jgi:hypothetical protein